MNRFALYVLAVIAVAGWVAAVTVTRRIDAMTSANAARIIRASDFTEADVSRNVDVDMPGFTAPEGSEGVARITGSVDFGEPDEWNDDMHADVGTSPEPGSFTEPTDTGNGPMSACAISPADIRGGADVSIVRADGDAFARVDWWAEIRLPDRTTVRRDATLPLSRVNVRPEVVTRHRAVVGRIRPFRQWRTGWVAGAGLTVGIDGRVDVAGFVGYAIQF